MVYPELEKKLSAVNAICIFCKSDGKQEFTSPYKCTIKEEVCFIFCKITLTTKIIKMTYKSLQEMKGAQ